MTEILPQQRRKLIEHTIEQYGQARVAELAAELDVSEMTVRRDLTYLEHLGVLVKVHGGAMRRGAPTSAEPGFTTKSALQTEEKDAIAAAAAALITPGSSVALSAGTTTFALAHHLTAVENLTVLTNSPRIAEVFWAADSPGRTVILTGGERTPSDALVGPIALESVRGLNVDAFFLGAHGISAERGLTTPNGLEAQLSRALLAAAARTVVVADHTKWGLTGLHSIAELNRVDTVVTDAALPTAARAELEGQDVSVVIAPEPSTPHVG